MSTFTLDVHIHAPELTAAILALAGKTAPSPDFVFPATCAAVPAAVPASPAAPAAPLYAAPPPLAAPIAPAAVIPPPAAPIAPVAGVPVAAEHAYTLDEIANAAAQLMDTSPDMMQRLSAMLAQFGVQSLGSLNAAQYGAVATALRGMGARI
ncbi:MAG: hypothetical protein RR825_03610 [Ruthenibacterium sp.]